MMAKVTVYEHTQTDLSGVRDNSRADRAARHHLPACCNRAGAIDLSATGSGKPYRKRRQGDWIEADRADLLRAGLLSLAALRGGKRLRRGGLGRHESWAD